MARRSGVPALLAAKEMVLVCGSGGVGKTTSAAAMGALAASEIGGRVLVLTVDPARRLADALGIELGNEAAARLGVPPPEGSQFLWIDVADRLGEQDLMAFLEACTDDGLLVAPGPSFGPYPTHARLCYTSAAPDVVRRGVGVLAGLLGA